MDKLTILIILAGVIVAELIALNVFLFMAIGKIKECAQSTDEQRSAVLKMVAMNSKVSNQPGQMASQITGSVNNQAMASQVAGNVNNQAMASQVAGNVNNQAMPSQITGNANNQAMPSQVAGNANNQAMAGQITGNANNQAMPSQVAGNANNQAMANQMPGNANNKPASLEIEKSMNDQPTILEPEATIMIPKSALKEDEKSTAEAKIKENEDGTIICSSCYTPLPAYGKFCPNCSAVIEGR